MALSVSSASARPSYIILRWCRSNESFSL